ncbi:AAA family ATPase [Pseudomonas fluorescens]
MRIDSLRLKNFKGFEHREFTFHPEFNLIVGTNGSGKTTALEALAVAAGSWFLGVRGTDTRHIRPSEVMLADFEHEEMDEDGVRHTSIQWEYIYPCEVTATGSVQDHKITWSRTLNTPGGRTTYGDAKAIKNLAVASDSAIRKGTDILLPLISYYGTGRLWQEPRDSYKVSDPLKVSKKEDQSRLAGYNNSVDPRLSVGQFTRWAARQSWIAYQQNNRSTPEYRAIKKAIIGCIENARDFYFDAKFGEIVIAFHNGTRPFSNLSDGQRCMLAMVGDIAQKASKLNPHLGSKVLEETQGVVIIDELDLHLHPLWQRRVVEDLRRTFPKIQFICTTHSPFLIQSLRSGEELIMLDGQPTAEVGNISIEEIAEGIQQVPNTQVSPRYEEMVTAAKKYLYTLEDAKKSPEDQLMEFKDRLASQLRPYADNPAFQAFLEMKRVAILGN